MRTAVPSRWAPRSCDSSATGSPACVFYLGYIWIFIDKRKRGWFDLIAGTVVVKADE